MKYVLNMITRKKYKVIKRTKNYYLRELPDGIWSIRGGSNENEN